jgi:hypothetical protein
MKSVIALNVVIIVGLIVVILILLKNKNNKTTRNSVNITTEPVKLVRVNIPSRGEVTKYEEVGVLSNGDRLLKLMGRETYGGSNKYQYYALSDNFVSSRLTVVKDMRECDETYGCNELYDGDQLTVPDISDTLKFKVNIHNNLDKNKLRYIPYVN